MSESSQNTDARLAPLIEYFGERVNRSFVYFFFTQEFVGDEDLRADPSLNARAWCLQTIQNACLDTTLIALRDLDDFLNTRTKHTKSDDIRASDLGFIGSHTFLTQSERDNINKLIAHTTIAGIASQGFRWDIFELTTKGIFQCLVFLRWIEKEYGLGHFNLYTAAIVIRTRTESQFAYISREAEKRRGDEPKRPK